MLTSPRIRHPADQTGFPTPTTTGRILHSPLSASLLDDETRPISFQPFHRRPRNHRLSPSPRPFLLQSAKPPSQLLARFLQKHAPKVQASRHTSQRCRSSRLSTHSSPTFFSELDGPNPHMPSSSTETRQTGWGLGHPCHAALIGSSKPCKDRQVWGWLHCTKTK